MKSKESSRQELTKFEWLIASVDVIVSKLELQIFESEFESHWVPYSYSFVPHLS